MDISKALDICFDNLGFATPYPQEEIDNLKLCFYELWDDGMFELDEKWYLSSPSNGEFLRNLAIDAMANITRRDPAAPVHEEVSQREIDKIPLTGDYANIARICLNMLDLSRYGIV